MKTVTVIKGCTAIAVLFASSAAFSQDGQMSGDELKALLGAGKKISLGGPGTGYSGSLMLNADGTGAGKGKMDDGKKNFTITGTWAIKGDEFCRTWKEFGDGKNVCERWIKTGNNKVDVLFGETKIGVNHW